MPGLPPVYFVTSGVVSYVRPGELDAVLVDAQQRHRRRAFVAELPHIARRGRVPFPPPPPSVMPERSVKLFSRAVPPVDLAVEVGRVVADGQLVAGRRVRRDGEVDQQLGFDERRGRAVAGDLVIALQRPARALVPGPRADETRDRVVVVGVADLRAVREPAGRADVLPVEARREPLNPRSAFADRILVGGEVGRVRVRADPAQIRRRSAGRGSRSWSAGWCSGTPPSAPSRCPVRPRPCRSWRSRPPSWSPNGR
jgi:hypothetical protein